MGTYTSAINTGTFGVAPRDAGVASASVNTGQQLGGAIGTALLNTIAASAATGYLASHAGRLAPQLVQLAAVHGYTTAFWWCAPASSRPAPSSAARCCAAGR